MKTYLDIDFNIMNFIKDNIKSCDLTNEQEMNVRNLCNRYKLDFVDSTTSVISAELGFLGSIRIINVVENLNDTTDIKYGDFLTINYNKSQIILWTDYDNTEPYNRNSGLYGFGSSFKGLDNPVAEFDTYREFNKIFNYNSNLSFRFDEYYFNTFYNTIKFDISIKTELVEEFITELRKILNK